VNLSLLKLVTELSKNSSMEWMLFDAQLQPRIGRIDKSALKAAQLARETNVVVEHRGQERLLAVPFKNGVVVLRDFVLDKEEFANLLKTILEALWEIDKRDENGQN